MKNFLFLIAFLFTTALSFAQQQEWVSGYTLNNGTYVHGYYRTVRDYTLDNNWTTIGNVNPHTGKAGTKPRDGYTTTRTTSSNYSTPTYRSTSTYSAPIQRSTYTPTYTPPVTTYSTPSYSSTQTIYTGSRGGQYYINSNGNKTYVSSY